MRFDVKVFVPNSNDYFVAHFVVSTVIVFGEYAIRRIEIFESFLIELIYCILKATKNSCYLSFKSLLNAFVPDGI
jgi:hypothetical protein